MLRQHTDNNQYCLSIPKTTVGSRDCELVIKGPDVAPQHFVIEKRGGADYILHDLGTSEGTFVNHCRVSGASVRLNCGDIIKLGPSSPAFTFITPGLLNNTTEVIVPAISEVRPGSAPSVKVQQSEFSGGQDVQRNHSATILSGRCSMKRNVLSGILPSVTVPKADAEKTELLDLLQQTVAAQEKKLSSLADDIKQFRGTDIAANQQTISHLEREVNTLKAGEGTALHKLEQQRSETQSANHTIASLQSELQGKTEREVALAREVETLQREKNDQNHNGTIRFSPVVTLRRQLAEKEAELRHVRAEFNAFKVRPDELKEQNIIFAKENKSLRKQVRDAKRTTQENQDKVTHLEGDLGELQTKLKHETRMHVTSRDMVGRLQTELSDKAKLEKLLKIEAKECQVQTKHLEAGVREALSRLGEEKKEEEEDLLKRLNELVSRHLDTTKTLSKREEELASSRGGYESLHENLARLELETLGLMEVVQESGYAPARVEKEGDKIAALDIQDNLKWLQGMVLTLTRTVQKFSSELERKGKLAENAAEAAGVPSNTGLENIIGDLKNTTISLREERNVLKEKLANTVDSYEGKLALQHRKHSATLKEEIDTLKRLHEEQMRGLYTSEQAKLNDIVCEYTAQLTNIKHKLGERETELFNSQQEVTESKANQLKLDETIEELKKAEKTSKMIEESLREKVSQFDSETLGVRQECAEQRQLAASLKEETDSLREQNRQYAVTIVSMENKLHNMSHKCTNMETELNSSLSKLEAVPPPPPEPYDVLKGREDELKRENQRLTTLANTLRREYGLAKAEADQRAVQVQGLRCDLAGAAARLSDMSGELSESQKIERENMVDKLEQQKSQLQVQRESIDMLTLELENAKKKLENVPEKLPKKALPKVKIEYKEREPTIEETDVMEKGKKCVEERHSIIIDKQRLALAEFRDQIKSKALQMSNSTVEPLDGSHQVTRLKKELSELRAALKQKEVEYSSKENDLKAKLNTTTEKNSDAAKLVKSELNDYQRLLGHSEACFASLATEVRSTLNQPQNPIDPLSIGKLEQNLKDRALLTADLGAQIVAITTRLKQKDVMLTTYQDDITQLKHNDTDSNGLEVSLLQKKVSKLQEESSGLKRSLTQLQGELDQQQRLNTALVQRQAAREVSSEPTLQHACPDPRTESQIELLKKQHNEEIKRKNYDIKKLKEELAIS